MRHWVALALMRLLPSNGRVLGGSVKLAGRELAEIDDDAFRREIRWKRMAMVFQSAMNALNPVLRIDRQLRDVYRLHRPDASDADVATRLGELYDLVGLPAERMDGYPHEFSGGMRQRAIIAMSLLCGPDLVIADEATTALDVVVQAQILRELGRLREELGLALIVISHDIGVIAQICDDVAVMYAGQVVESGPVGAVFDRPRHPYTAALSAAIPALSGPRRRLVSLSGDPPDLTAQRVACTFADRCPLVRDICREQDPPVVSLGGQHSKCHFAADPQIGRLARGEL
jgi:oligopeptide/dipeptide ABC transporter ATP-binding protein